MKNYLVESMTSLYGNLNEAISGWNEDEYTHFAFRCQDCPALVAGDNDEWICDEVEKPCSQVVECPEGLGILVDDSTSESVEEHLISDYDYDEYTDDVSDAYDRGEITAAEKHAEYERLGRMLEEDYTSDLRSDVYNVLADIMFKYHNKGIKVTPEQMQSAFEWFDVHFWTDEDLDEACNSEHKEELKEDINTPFIKIYKEGQVAEEGWDYPVEELNYLLEEHPGESFVLQDDRLYEINEE